jgi:hypothetical protein
MLGVVAGHRNVVLCVSAGLYLNRAYPGIAPDHRLDWQVDRPLGGAAMQLPTTRSSACPAVPGRYGLEAIFEGVRLGMGAAADSGRARDLWGPFDHAGHTPKPISRIYFAAPHSIRHALTMFVVTEAQAAAIRTVYEQRGEFSAAVELRQLFPGIVDNAQARLCVRTITGWPPLPPRLRPMRPRPD